MTATETVDMGERVRMVREALGLSRERAAQASGLTAAVIQNYEQGKARVKAEDLWRIAQGWGQEVGLFYDEQRFIETKRAVEEALCALTAPTRNAGVPHEGPMSPVPSADDYSLYALPFSRTYSGAIGHSHPSATAPQGHPLVDSQASDARVLAAAHS